MARRKDKRTRDPFPRVMFGQMAVEHTEENGEKVRRPYLQTHDTEEDCCDMAGDGSDFEAGERVGVYRLVEVVTLTKRVSITRKKAK